MFLWVFIAYEEVGDLQKDLTAFTVYVVDVPAFW